MKRPDIAQTIQILANVGILAGIIFLVVEVRQNNEALAAQARYNRVSNAINAWRSLAENGDLADLRVRAARGETLTETEQYRVNASLMSLFVGMDWVFRELPDDAPEKRTARALMRGILNDEPHALRLWDVQKSGFDPGFVAWVDEEVLDDPPE